VPQHQQGANAGDVKISSHDGTLAVMQMVKSAKMVGSEIGFTADALAWHGADQALRPMAGRPANQMVQFPYVRMFNADTIGELELTPEPRSPAPVRLDRLPGRLPRAVGLNG
jgi:hypothetical protein